MTWSIDGEGRAEPSVDLTRALPGGLYERLFDSIGRKELQRELLMLLNEICGADSVHLFRLKGDRPDIASGVSLVGGQGLAISMAQAYMGLNLWRGDREMSENSYGTRDHPTVYRLATNDAPTSDLRDFYHSEKIVERLMICAQTSMGVLGFSILRAAPRPLLSADNLPDLSRVFSGIFPIVSKHMEMIGQSRRIVESLTSLSLIEQYLESSDVPLARRELQVGARLLYGLSASCVAADLGIGFETVSTHRKRLYERLGISCHHELLLWYLKQCAEVQGGGALSRIDPS